MAVMNSGAALRRGAGMLAVVGFLMAAAVMARGAEIAETVTAKLLEDIKSENVNTAAGAARSIGTLFAVQNGVQPKKGLDKVIEALEAAVKSDVPEAWVVRRAAADALGNLDAKTAAPTLKGALQDTEIEVVIAATDALGKVLPADEMRTLMHAKLKETGPAQSAAARYLSIHAKPEDVEALFDGLGSTDWRTQKHCATGLATIAAGGAKLPDKVLGKLTELLGNDILNVVTAAKATLAAAKSDEVVAALGKAARTTGDGGEADTSWRVRTAAIEILGQIGMPMMEKEIPAIIAGLGDDTRNVVQAARQALVKVPGEKLYPLLLQQLEATQVATVRAGILESMSDAVPPKYMQTAADLALKSLKEAGEGQDAARLRAAAISLLGASGSDQAAEEIVKAVTANEAIVRAAALRALPVLKLKDEQREAVALRLLPGLDEKEWQKVTAAAQALQKFPCAAAIKPLAEKGLPHETLNVQDAATTALIACARDEKLKGAVEEAVLAEIKANKAAQEYGAVVIAALKTKDAVGPLVEMILEEGDDDHWRTQVNAAKALAAIGVKTEAVRAALIKCAQSSNILQVQNAANAALRVLGTE